MPNNPRQITQLPVDPGDAWTDAALLDLESMEPQRRQVWLDLLHHCRQAKSARPSGKWLARAVALRDQIDDEAFEERSTRWFALADLPRTAPETSVRWRELPAGSPLMFEAHADVLRGLCWIAGRRSSPDLARALGSLALSCYRKVPGCGPRAVKVGNASVQALGQMPGRASLGQLAMLRVKVKFGAAQKILEKSLDEAARREGLPREEIEEIAVPAYGMTDVGLQQSTIDEYTARLEVGHRRGGRAVELAWVNPQGRVVKSIPAIVKRNHPDELKDLRAAAKDVQAMLPAQRDRIDNLFIEPRSWPLAAWRERYLDHPLVGTLARRLIWLFNDGRAEVAAAWLSDDPAGAPYGPGRLVRADGEAFDPGERATVALWRPIDPKSPPGSTATRGDIAEWRAFYEQREICQPFKQAHREIYLLTEAERRTHVYSNRFVAHILRQHQFHALCAARGWKNRLRLFVDDEYPPAMRLLPAWDLRAEYWIEGVGDTWDEEFMLESGAYRYLTTDQVRFHRLGAPEHRAHAYGGTYRMLRADQAEASAPIPLDQIPPLVLSEVLRDVDLFVGVSTVGNDPQWQDGGPAGSFRDYWRERSFGDLGETAQTRRRLLERIVPRLAIADCCTVTDKFLVVLGRRRTYKIHLGSGNILMEPNDQYLCIVPTTRMESGPADGGIFLPFEGDRTLAIILSKAFLLARDDKITDETILRQIA